MNIVTELPGWFILFCILLGAAFALFLYYKNSKEDFSTASIRILAILRFAAVTIVAFLLLSPMLKSIFRTSEKPIVIIAQDNSQSLLVGKDSVFYKNEYPEKIDQIEQQLEKKYDVRVLSFSDKITEGKEFTFTGKQTDISMMMDEVMTRFANRNVGAMLLASDGIYNKGLNPVYSSDKIKFPVYTLGLGDTSIRKDIYIRKVNFNRIAYLGNNFPLEVIIGANRCKNAKSTLTVFSKSKTLFTQSIEFPNDQYTGSVLVQLEASEPGLQRFHLQLTSVSDEISLTNNQDDIFVDVLDSRQKILILAAAPHPDIAALKESIESNYNYEVSRFLADDFDGNAGEYNLIILHQLPTISKTAINIITQATGLKIPVLYILGTQTALAQFDLLNAGLQVNADKAGYNESLPSLNNEFGLFTLSEETRKAISDFPPLIAPFGSFKTLTSANTMVYQQIGSLKTTYPLILFNHNLINKTGIIAGEGLWRWRLTDYYRNGNHLAFNELITKIVQYLSVKVDKSFFRVDGPNNFLENEPIEFTAEVYNESYELVNDADVEINIVNSTGSSFPFVFSKTAKAYYLNAGLLPVDNYSWEAKVRFGDKIYRDNGEFTVSPLNIETLNTIADHNLLYRLAGKHDGILLTTANMDQFPELLEKREDIKTITYSEKRYSELVNVFWVLLAILALLAGEWFIRKRNGSY